MSTEACRNWREQIGAIALGGLSAEEEARLEAHMEGCPTCRAEVEELQRTATLLATVDPARFEKAEEAPPELAARIGKRIGTERRARRRRRRLLGGGIGAAAAGAAAVLALIVFSGGTGASPEQLAFTQLPPGVRVTADLEPQSSGTQITVGVEGVKWGTECHVFVRKQDGALVPAGSFRYVRDWGGKPPVLSAAADLAEIDAVIVRAGPRTFEQTLESS